MPKGTVKSFDEKRGFGFIAPNDGSPDLIFYSADIHTASILTLDEGASVEYDLIQTDRGTRVDNVRSVD